MMKKLLAFVLVTVMILSICSCGQASIKSQKDSYVGVWESAHMRFTIDEGGVGRYEQPGTNTGFFDFTWELEDEVLTINIMGSVKDWVATFELNDEGSALILKHNGLPGYIEGETMYYKLV